jgi:hypothetical protein
MKPAFLPLLRARLRGLEREAANSHQSVTEIGQRLQIQST